MEKIACNITKQLICENLIDDSKKEAYVYALQTLMERFVCIGSILLIGAVTKKIVPTIFFLIFFFGIKKENGWL